MNVPPRHIELVKTDLLFVVDCNNARDLLLSASLDDVKELIPRRDVTKRWGPLRHCLDERDGVLYVVEDEWDGKDYTAGQLVKYKVKTI